MTTPDIEKVLHDPAASYWIKEALTKAILRDPVDAANDAARLHILLIDRNARIESAMKGGK